MDYQQKQSNVSNNKTKISKQYQPAHRHSSSFPAWPSIFCFLAAETSAVAQLLPPQRSAWEAGGGGEMETQDTEGARWDSAFDHSPWTVLWTIQLNWKTLLTVQKSPKMTLKTKPLFNHIQRFKHVLRKGFILVVLHMTITMVYPLPLFAIQI